MFLWKIISSAVKKGTLKITRKAKDHSSPKMLPEEDTGVALVVPTLRVHSRARGELEKSCRSDWRCELVVYFKEKLFKSNWLVFFLPGRKEMVRKAGRQYDYHFIQHWVNCGQCTSQDRFLDGKPIWKWPILTQEMISHSAQVRSVAGKHAFSGLDSSLLFADDKMLPQMNFLSDLIQPLCRFGGELPLCRYSSPLNGSFFIHGLIHVSCCWLVHENNMNFLASAMSSIRSASTVSHLHISLSGRIFSKGSLP